MSEASDHNDNDDIGAAEYAMHLLSPQDRRVFEARLNDEPGLRILVAEWHERLVLLAGDVDEVAPRPAVKAALQRQLFAPVTPQSAGLWNRIAVWRGLSLASVVAAAVFAALLYLQQPPQPGPVLVAEVSAADESLRMLARYDANTGVLEVSRLTGQAVSGRALELWVIAAQGKPISLGVLPVDARGQLEIAPNLRPLMSDAVLAISDEPLGGSPTGAPTGRVLAVGQINSV